MRAKVLAGRYRIDEPVGAGGMGSVWRATDLELRRVVAVKRATNGDAEMIRREARAGASLQHPQVISVFDVVVEDDERWLVMEYLPGRSLAQVVREDGKLPPGQAAHVGAQVAEALQAMHAQGFVHRDITPGNVLVGDNGTVKLTDLGIAMWADATVTGESQLAGTPGYAAPEVTAGHVATPASDVYSLGATLMEAVEPDGPLAPVLATLTDPKPARRPTALQAQRSLLDGVPNRRSRRWPFVAAATLVLAVAVTAAVVLWPSKQPPEQQHGPKIIGEPRTADPCSLIDEKVFDHLGRHWMNPDHGDFSQCQLVVEVPDQGQALVTVLLADGADGGSGVVPPPATGGIVVDRRAQEYDACSRIIRLPELYRVEIIARFPDNKAADACAVAQLPVNSVLEKLKGGELPRRAPFPADSLAQKHACSLLTSGDAMPRELATAQVLPGFGDWECNWLAQGGQVRALVLLHRSDPVDRWEGVEKIPVGNRDGLLLRDGWGKDKCLVEVPFRNYTSADGSQKVEYAAVVVRDEQTVEQRCAVATTLATAVSSALSR